MDITIVVGGIIITLWLLTTAAAVRFRNSSKRQNSALRSLQDREVEWALYTHLLRRDHIENTGTEPRALPEKLKPLPFDAKDIGKY